MRLVVDSVRHLFFGKQQREALVDLSFGVDPGQFIALIGPSGCGKSTLLRLIANLLQPTKGQITLDGKPPGEIVPDRRIAWMSQSPALLPWLTVQANVEMAQRFHSPEFLPRLSSEDALRKVGLADVSDDFPSTLSGGMQQRLALARTLIMGADLWLMDEPFAALDELTRERLTRELLELWEPLRPTVLWVTHNIREALLLADRVLVISPPPGRLVADAPVSLERPRNESSPDFQELLKTLRSYLEEIPLEGVSV